MTTFYNEARKFAKKYIDSIAKEIDNKKDFLKKYLKS